MAASEYGYVRVINRTTRPKSLRLIGGGRMNLTPRQSRVVQLNMLMLSFAQLSREEGLSAEFVSEEVAAVLGGGPPTPFPGSTGGDANAVSRAALALGVALPPPPPPPPVLPPTEPIAAKVPPPVLSAPSPSAPVVEPKPPGPAPVAKPALPLPFGTAPRVHDVSRLTKPPALSDNKAASSVPVEAPAEAATASSTVLPEKPVPVSQRSSKPADEPAPPAYGGRSRSKRRGK